MVTNQRKAWCLIRKSQKYGINSITIMKNGLVQKALIDFQLSFGINLGAVRL